MSKALSCIYDDEEKKRTLTLLIPIHPYGFTVIKIRKKQISMRKRRRERRKKKPVRYGMILWNI